MAYGDGCCCLDNYGCGSYDRCCSRPPPVSRPSLRGSSSAFADSGVDGCGSAGGGEQDLALSSPKLQARCRRSSYSARLGDGLRRRLPLSCGYDLEYTARARSSYDSWTSSPSSSASGVRGAEDAVGSVRPGGVKQRECFTACFDYTTAFQFEYVFLGTLRRYCHHRQLQLSCRFRFAPPRRFCPRPAASTTATGLTHLAEKPSRHDWMIQPRRPMDRRDSL